LNETFWRIAGIPIKEDAVTLLNGSIGLYDEQAGWSLVPKGSNLLDKEYLFDAGNTGGSFGNPTFIAGPSRLVHLEFRQRFEW